ncbi:uncharacterized protein LOC130725174 [Lotus japonicus]|uniref:uncharacterized protein LOC130725174 n=1 Tax=Lotus japonicus TaxID=34305 RepID=UPI002586FDFE|nr:uncharacterized protein LOC130725174 [Lotus japonicus]
MASGIGHAFPSHFFMPAQQRWVRWCPTLEHSVLVNVCGSVLGVPRRGGFDGYLRSFDGDLLAGFYGFRPDLDILLLELLVIYHGLAMAWDPRYRTVECQSNFLHAVGLVLSTPASRHMYALLIWDIKDLSDRL